MPAKLQVRADADLTTGDVPVDSAVARAHHHAACARKRGLCNGNQPVVMSNRTTTGSDAPAAG